MGRRNGESARFCVAAVLMFALIAPRAALAQVVTLNVAPVTAPLGTSMTFSGTISGIGVGAAPPAFVLDYGDGTAPQAIPAAPLVVNPFSFVHRYAQTGFYSACVKENGKCVATVSPVVLAPAISPRVPSGTIYSSMFTLSPVLSGGQTDILVVYKVNAPAGASGTDPMEAYVDLLDQKGNLIHRSDTFEISIADFSGPGTKTVKIPYLVPTDAVGTYGVVVTFRSAQGGTIMRSNPMALLIIGGPDPSPRLSADFHSTGSVEIGPHAGSPGVTFDPGMSLGLLLPNSTGTLSGLFDPVSHRADPVLTVKSGAATGVAAPDTSPVPAGGPSPAPGATQSAAPAATSAPSPAPRSYTDIGGRGQSGLPAVLGGGSTLRGLDLTNQTGNMTYQAGYGYTNVATGSLSAQRGLIADVTRALGTGSARLTYFGRDDDPSTYISSTGTTGPLATGSEVFELNSPQYGPLKVFATGALSQAHGLLTDYRVDDAADKIALAYVKGSVNVTFDYHNAGRLFAVGGGPQAVSDRVGFASAATMGMGSATQLLLGYTKDEARSAFTRQSDAFGTFNFTLPNSGTLQLGVKRDTQLAPTANITTDSGIVTWTGKVGIGTYNFSGNIASANDMLTGASSATTRTLALQYALQTNAHALGIGINTTSMSGSTAMSTVGESLTYGFPFGGHVVGGAVVHGLELQLSGTNITNATPAIGSLPGTGTTDRGANALLAYHLSAHLAIGLRGELTWHSDIVTANNSKASALRLRFDLTQ